MRRINYDKINYLREDIAMQESTVASLEQEVANAVNPKAVARMERDLRYAKLYLENRQEMLAELLKQKEKAEEMAKEEYTRVYARADLYDADGTGYYKPKMIMCSSVTAAWNVCDRWKNNPNGQNQSLTIEVWDAATDDRVQALRSAIKVLHHEIDLLSVVED